MFSFMSSSKIFHYLFFWYHISSSSLYLWHCHHSLDSAFPIPNFQNSQFATPLTKSQSVVISFNSFIFETIFPYLLYCFLKENSKSTPKKGKLVFKDESPLPPKKRAAEESVQSETKGSSSLGKKKKSSTATEAVSTDQQKTSKKENTDVKNENKDGKEEENKSQTGAAGAPSLEKKKSYYAYKAREGPRNLGSKEIPQVNFCM